MKTLLAAMALALTTGSAALAFDADTQGMLDRLKAGKLVPIGQVAQLMQSSAQWCYINQNHSCAWTDIYLEVTETGATFEIANAWDAEIDVAFTDRGEFKDDRYICESGEDWVPSVRGSLRSGAGAVTGRSLWDLKLAIAANQARETQDCFDYVYLGSDKDQQVVTLLQRQYTDDVHIASNDVEVTVHMSSEDAAGLTLRW